MKAIKITIDYPDRIVTLNRDEAEEVMEHVRKLPGVTKLNWRVKMKKSAAGAKLKESTPMNLKQFVEWCRKSKQPHVQLIGEWAEELYNNYSFKGFTTYGEWNRLFFKQNLRAARDLEPSWKQENGRTRMSEATALLVSESKNGHWKTGNLSTLIKYMSKV